MTITDPGLDLEDLPTPTFSQHTQVQRDLQRTALTQPLYPEEGVPKNQRMGVWDTDEQDQLDQACAEVQWSPHTSDDDETLQIWLQLARLLPTLGIVPLIQNPNTAPFHWAKARCLFAGAGHAAHAQIATILTGLYSTCDMDPAEGPVVWEAALTQARLNCGWPAHLARLTWKDLTRALAWVDPEAIPEQWHIAVAALHVLKHMRVRDAQLAIVYDGTACIMDAPDGSNIIALNPRTLANVTQVLGCPLGKNKTIHPLTIALRIVLKRISIDKLLTQKPLAELAGDVIAGPWSSTEPDPGAVAFVQTGMRLSGVWRAANGKVSPFPGEPIDALCWAWNLANPAKFAETREALIAGMPTTYPTSWPADLLMAAFPNLDLSWTKQPTAARTMLELPVFASLLRRPGSPLSREFPFVLFIPDQPTFEGSTNQGKTAITRTLVRSMAPGAPTVVAPDTSSAPDSRAFVDVLAQHGTAGLDEWTPPSNRHHPLGHANLQTLCTGGQVTFGRVMENSGMLALRHSLVAGAKAVDFPPDMQSRTLCWPLKSLTDAERNRPDVKALVDSGALSLQLRLAALYMIEKHDIAAKLAAAPLGVQGSFRFDAHAALAKILYEIRVGQPEQGHLGVVFTEMQARLCRHTQDAESSGIMSAQDSGSNGMKVRLPDLLAGLTDLQCDQIEQELSAARIVSSRQIGPQWNTPTQLIDAIRKVRSLPSLQSLLPSLLGRQRSMSDRAIILALGRGLKSTLSVGQVYPIPESSYGIERGTDQSGFLRIRVSRVTMLTPDATGPSDGWGLTTSQHVEQEPATPVPVPVSSPL